MSASSDATKTDIVDLLEATADGKLSELEPLEWDERPSTCVVMASEGYPGDYEKGRVITGIESADALENVKVFHAGTKLENDQILNDGGRVLGGLHLEIRSAKRNYKLTKQ